MAQFILESGYGKSELALGGNNCFGMKKFLSGNTWGGSTWDGNCVIVKDFSRFGRDYIELGDYLERIFPFMGVRFISINDHYDSLDYKGTTGGLDDVVNIG